MKQMNELQTENLTMNVRANETEFEGRKNAVMRMR
jgi:hypothetical protein